MRSIAAFIAFAFAVVSSADDIERGLISQKFKSPRGVIEQCIVTKRLPNWPVQAEQENEDIQKEATLCEFNFYSESGSTAVGLCPKLNSTNPSVLLYSTEAHTKTQLEEALCKQRDVEADLIAKFKQSVSCSYTPSLLAYYHFSKILSTPEVPRVVLRTMDIETHKKIRTSALSTLSALNMSNQTIYTTWNDSWGYVYRNMSSDRGLRVVTPDGQQIYGALSVNPSKEVRYKEVYGSWRNYEARFDSLRAQSPYQNIIDSRSVEQIAGAELSQSSFQTVLQMKDVSGMLLIDYILSQQDRPGNIHYYNMIYYSADGKKWSKVKAHKADKKADELNAAIYKFSVKEMLMKDNDCGVAKGNATREQKLLDNLAHIDPQTYKKIGQLAKLWASNVTATEKYLQDELMFTKKDVIAVKNNLTSLFALLQKRCRSGELHLDLDVKSFLKREPKTTVSCELE